MLQNYKHFLNQQNIILKLFLRAILPALAGGFQTFVQLALQQLFGGQFGHILRHLDARFVELQQLYLLVATFGAEQQAEWRLLTSFHFMGYTFSSE